MSFSLIEEGINKAKAISCWGTSLIKYNHKKHPNEFTCYTINFNTPKLLKDTVSDMCSAYLKVVEKYDKVVQTYTGFNPKNIVDKLSITDDLIKDNWKTLINHINSSDDATNLKDIKANAFIFVGTYNNGSENLYLISRKNPLITFKKTIFTCKNNCISKTTDPLIQFGRSFDALIYKNTIYMINLNCESIFNMEYSHKKICKNSLDLLEKSNIIEDIASYRQFATFGHTPKKFITYDSSLVEKLKQDRWKKELSKVLKIPINPNTNKFDLTDSIHANIFTLAICGKTKLNMFKDGICQVPNSTPLKVS